MSIKGSEFADPWMRGGCDLGRARLARVSDQPSGLKLRRPTLNPSTENPTDRWAAQHRAVWDLTRSSCVVLIQRDREEAHNEDAQNDARSDLTVHGSCRAGDDSWVAPFDVVISSIGSTDRRLESTSHSRTDRMVISMKRRDSVAQRVIIALVVPWLTFANVRAAETAPMEFTLKETAGLARFGYPVCVEVPLESGSAEADFRLMRNGRDVPAQFRRVVQPNGHFILVLDFNASPGPFQIEKYTVVCKPGAKPFEERGRGMSVRLDGSTFHVSHSPYIDYAIANDLAGLVRSVKIPAAEFIREGSPGLFVVVNGRKTQIRSREHASGSTPRVRVTREGPLAIGLRASLPLAIPDAERVAATINVTFPSSKSWIETVYTLDDPNDQVEAMGVDLTLLIDTVPVLVDCGANRRFIRHSKKRTF